VDISEHFYKPASASRQRIPQFQQNGQDEISEDALRAMMLGNALPPSGGQQPMGNPFAGFPGMDGMGMGPGMGGPPGADDPMMKILQQMMGGAPVEGADGMPTFPGMPPMGMPGQAVAADPYAYLWRIVHAVFALALGFYVALTTTFTGTKLEREMSIMNGGSNQISGGSIQFFYIFATMEVVLQTSRFFLEKGRIQQTGIIGTILTFLPEPWKGYVELVLRYSRIWTTVSADAMVAVFVLGVCAWLRAAGRL
jgi:hypothetical protein